MREESRSVVGNLTKTDLEQEVTISFPEGLEWRIILGVFKRL